ncbi:uncharacterized protein P884DRAFT_116207 [Thermothelomyces heterothallicus CBS 202.75]|uniref:uncharacterized protein n=1 Tax=Thermothelomyces heterothallicus CBS 202.75 TaxID=1149848 RepID=UPI0037426D3C
MCRTSLVWMYLHVRHAVQGGLAETKTASRTGLAMQEVVPSSFPQGIYGKKNSRPTERCIVRAGIGSIIACQAAVIRGSGRVVGQTKGGKKRRGGGGGMDER